MKIQPTKRWLREHPACPYFKTAMKDCHRIGEMPRGGDGEEGAEFCVGVNLEKGDLDVINFCTEFRKLPHSDEIESRCYQIHAQETLHLVMLLNLAIGELFQLDPDFRKRGGIMLRQRNYQLKRLVGRWD